jgi:DNA adenine methylase
MYQPRLFDDPEHIVNVASVPQRSLFRYPGGKTWLIPRIRQWLNPSVRRQARLRAIRIAEFIEPFAGGGSVGLTVAAESLAEHVTMVERDEDVAAVWQTSLDPDGSAWLIEQILTFNLNYETVVELLTKTPTSNGERAFATIIKNRTYHGGILASGAGLLKYGENGKGISSRWYPATLAQRIRKITELRHRITFIAGDGLAVIAALARSENAAFFIDPPYTVNGKGKRAGRRLYRYSELNHEQLFALVATLQGDCLMTYDIADEVRELAIRHRLEYRPIPMQNTHHATMQEYLIGPDLTWLDEQTIGSG